MQHQDVGTADANDDIVVDAREIAEGLGLDVAKVPELMRQGKITSVNEKGIDEDAGRNRITFFHSKRSFQLVIDASGTVIERS